MKPNDIRKMEMAVRHMERARACLDYVEESLYKQPRESLTTGGTTYSEAKEFSEDITRLLLMLEARTRVFKELLTK